VDVRRADKFKALSWEGNMHQGGRDLLVLSNKISLTPQQLEKELQSLHELLYSIETSNHFCTANEVINLNNYKIITKPRLIEKSVREAEKKPFIFIFNKN
jgi:hypothetical protein